LNVNIRVQELHTVISSKARIPNDLDHLDAGVPFLNVFQDFWALDTGMHHAELSDLNVLQRRWVMKIFNVAL